MDPRHFGANPGSSSSGSGSGGSGGQLVDTSARRRRRMSTPSTGTRLMPAFNAAAGDGDGGSWGLSSSSSSGALDLGPDESRPRYSRHRAYPEFSPMTNMGRLLFQGSPLGSRTTDDDVLVMDGVLVAKGSGSGSRRSPSFADLGFVNAGSPSSGGSGRYGANRQFAYGKESSRVVRAMYPRYSEVELQSGRSAVQGAGPNMQWGPRAYPHLPPSLPGATLPTPAAAAPRGASTAPLRPPAAPYFTPPRASSTTPARAPAGSPWVSKQREAKPPPVQRATFSWPPTEEEDAFITQWLYIPRRPPHGRLPVFQSICPA